MMSALPEPVESDYEADFYRWTRTQADRLRTLQSAGRIPAELDVENIAEEIESLGRSDLHAVETQLVTVLAHLLRAVSKANSLATFHWRSEGIIFTRDMQRRYSRSMRGEIGLQMAWQQAQHLAEVSLEADGSRLLRHLPQKCPFTIEELLESDTFFDDLEAKLATRIGESKL